jgi:phosphoglycolate phosphatase/putative hydrolase of the HAD superfamily
VDLDWRHVRLVVFDVDGTLYDQSKLRQRMMGALLVECLRRPRQLRSLRTIAEFRRQRERLATTEEAGIRELQYRFPADRLGMEVEEVRRIIEDWMLERPLAYLRDCRWPRVGELFEALRSAGVRVAVLSDYPASSKLAALGLQADLEVSAVDPEVDRLKPHPQGLLRTLEVAGVEPAAALMIGDRDDRDGEAARRAGVPYLIKTLRRHASVVQFRDYGDVLRAFRMSTAEDVTLE